MNQVDVSAQGLSFRFLQSQLFMISNGAEFEETLGVNQDERDVEVGGKGEGILCDANLHLISGKISKLLWGGVIRIPLVHQMQIYI